MAQPAGFQERFREVTGLAVTGTKGARPLAARLGVSPQTIYNILAGHMPQRDTLESVEREFGRSVEWLMYGDRPDQEWKPETPEQLLSWTNQITRGLATNLQAVINAEVERRLAELDQQPPPTPALDNVSDLTERRLRQMLQIGSAMPILADVAAGVPIPAQENIQGYIRFEADRHYVLTVRGDSMVDAGIHDGDWVIVDRQGDFAPREVVVARVHEDNEATVKYYEPGPRVREITLTPANKAYEPRTYADTELTIDGKVVAILRPIEPMRRPRRRRAS